jgi:hypothetical protein
MNFILRYYWIGRRPDKEYEFIQFPLKFVFLFFMKRFHLLFLATFACFPLSAISKERPARPNIVLILADDLGWQDVGCYDIDEPTPMETPHIDALAEEVCFFFKGTHPLPRALQPE